MRKIWKALAGIVLALAVCFGAGSASEKNTMHREVDDPAIEMTAEIGYQGRITYGKAMPLRVRIRNNGAADLEGRLGINAYLDTRRYSRYETEVSVPSGAEMEFVLPFSVMTLQEIFTPEITVDGKVVEAVNIVLEKNRVIEPGNLALIGVLSTKPNKLSNMSISREDSENNYVEYWQTVGLDRDTFPDQTTLLDAFRVIVIDDIDPASLSEKQQEALRQWIEGRHALLCSGTAANVAYFSDRTGLEITGATTSRSVLSGLETMIGENPSGVRKGVTLSRLAGAEPLAADDAGNGLVYRAETGNGRIYTTAYEMGASGLLNERSMRFFWQNALKNYDMNLYDHLDDSYDSNSINAVIPASQISIPVRSPMLPALLAGAGALALGWVLWLILKRKGKQTWMWLAAPALAAAAAGVVLLISGGSRLNQPMVTYTENIVQMEDGSMTRILGISAAAPGPGIHSVSLEGAPISVEYTRYVSPDEDDNREISEPTEMETCYTGNGAELAYRTGTPWEMTPLESAVSLTGIGRISGEIWMEDDGLHGEIRNDTDLSLKEGRVITAYGYVSVPALKPGETASCTLKKTTRKANANSSPADGEMSMDAGYGMYTHIWSAVGLAETWVEDGPAAMWRDFINAALYQMTGEYDYSSSGNLFLYSAEAEDSRALTIRVDGKQAENTAGKSMINAEIPFLPNGKTGVGCRMPDMDRAVLRRTNENGMPEEETDNSPQSMYDKNTYSYSLTENPVFRFTLDLPSRTEVTTLMIGLDYYDVQARCWLLNATTGAWDEITLNRNVSDPGNYVDADGKLFCRFEPGANVDYYSYISAPKLMMEGRTLHAED